MFACYHYGVSIIRAINSSLKFKTTSLNPTLYSSKSQRGIAIIAARIKVKQGTGGFDHKSNGLRKESIQTRDWSNYVAKLASSVHAIP